MVGKFDSPKPFGLGERVKLGQMRRGLRFGLRSFFVTILYQTLSVQSFPKKLY